MTTRITLSNTQYEILEHAIDHNDGQIIWFPDNVKGGARHKVIHGLLNKALITRDDNANCGVTAEGYGYLVFHDLDTAQAAVNDYLT